MPKKRPEPFRRAERNCYLVQIGKKRHRLSADETEAWRIYHELMARPPQESTTAAAAATVAPSLVVEVRPGMPSADAA